MEFENRYREWANQFCLVLLYAHLPVLMGIAWWFGTGILSALLIGLTILAGPTALFFTNRRSKAISLSIACSTMGISALMIHLGQGMIELHFHIFAAIAFLIVFGSIWPILAAAGTVAVHHLLFWWLLPHSVFNYKAGFGIVLVHAAFVVFETGPACWIAIRVGRAIQAQSITSGHLKHAAEHMLAAARQVSVSGEELSQCATEQAATLEETSASGTEISATSQSSAQNMEAAVKHIGEVDARMHHADQTLDSLTKGMADISQSSDRISQMIRVIDSIAMQTNILALNAAVESARAGAAGAGFAVVADEVRALAQRCTEAAKTSAQLISESVKSSRTGNGHVEEITAAILGIGESTREAKGLIERAHAGSQEQAKGVTVIASALHQLEVVTQRAAANAQENAAIAQTLEEQAQQLMQIVVKLDELSAIGTR